MKRSLAVAAVVTLLVAGCAASSFGPAPAAVSPSMPTSVPTVAPSASLVEQTMPPDLATLPASARPSLGAVCETDRRAPTAYRGAAAVHVDPAPASVTVEWIPGMNADPCVGALRRVSADRAATIAADVNSAPVMPDGEYSCPMDDGAAAELFFTYAGKVEPEVVYVALRGCRTLSGQGQTSRWNAEALLRDLAPLAPANFTSYLK